MRGFAGVGLLVAGVVLAAPAGAQSPGGVEAEPVTGQGAGKVVVQTRIGTQVPEVLRLDLAPLPTSAEGGGCGGGAAYEVFVTANVAWRLAVEGAAGSSWRVCGGSGAAEGLPGWRVRVVVSGTDAAAGPPRLQARRMD